ncbi:hypothetical protein GV828_03235 [Flavobacterium sp. NST-5]|uniref:Uncharacterized protein n=1 Tax=Flavobacterium ichthyis TaxID=2698827 RepID=A0ABW9ZA66_9FLAO|nr:hypothetical protein [Flavobacterium ichthyis]NBL64212.1 hypothetical protein [Flavobacterium ichthyis]
MKIDLEKDPKIKGGFSVPDDYFLSLERRILEQIDGQKEVPVISFFQKNKAKIFAVAASLTAVALALTVTFQQLANPEITDVTIENYLAEQSNLSQYEIIEQLNDADIYALENELLAIDESSAENYLAESNYIENYLSE